MDWYKDFPVLIISDHLGASNSQGRAWDQIKTELEKWEVKVLGANTLEDGRMVYFSRPDVGC
ncbi:MAG: hypothetical protein K9K36_12455, partial [Desulfarculaceae bacterium]|nr:hypothetical protein [Desulfarculaceae bacterium]